jgi:hypothetical protein
MASPNSATLLNGVISYADSRATLRLDGPDVTELYGYRTLFPDELKTRSAAERGFLGIPQLVVFFTSQKPDITAKDFKANAQATIEIQLKIVGKNTLEKFEYQLTGEICSVQNLPRVLGKDHYCYKLTMGQPTVILKSLETARPKIYHGTVAEVITKVCTDNGLTEKQFDVSHIKKLGLVRDYIQNGAAWDFIQNDILRPNGLVAILTEANQVVFAADPSIYQPTNYPTIASIYPVSQQSNTFQDHTAIFEFSVDEPLRHEHGVKVHSSSIESLNKRKQVQGGFAEKHTHVSTFHLSGESNDDNNALAERLQQSMESITCYSGVATFPLRLMETMNLEWTSIDGKPHVTPIAITSFSEIVCSFFRAAPANNPAALDHTAWTGLPPQTMRYRFTAVPKTYLPRLQYIEPQPVLYEGIIVGADGKLDSTQATFKDNQLYVGLISLFRKTPLDQFTSDQIVLANSCEPFVLQNSAPFGGRLVYVWYHPKFGTFTVAGAYRTAAFDDKTVVQTVNPQAKEATPMLTVSDKAKEINVTASPESIVKLSSTEFNVMSTAEKFSTPKGELTTTATTAGLDIKAEKGDITITAENLTQSVAKQVTNKSESLQETVTKTFKTSAGDYVLGARKVDMDAPQVEINLMKLNGGAAPAA